MCREYTEWHNLALFGATPATTHTVTEENNELILNYTFHGLNGTTVIDMENTSSQNSSKHVQHAGYAQ